MTKKNDAAPMQVQKGKTTPVEEPKKVLPNTKLPTREELEIRVQELEKQIAAVPKELSKRIEYFNEKKELIRKLSRLDANKENLTEHLDALSEIAAKNEFESEDYFLTIESGGKYNKKAVFSLQNPVIIGEMISFILGRIDVKREELKKQIEA